MIPIFDCFQIQISFKIMPSTDFQPQASSNQNCNLIWEYPSNAFISSGQLLKPDTDRLDLQQWTMPLFTSARRSWSQYLQIKFYVGFRFFFQILILIFNCKFEDWTYLFGRHFSHDKWNVRAPGPLATTRILKKTRGEEAYSMVEELYYPANGTCMSYKVMYFPPSWLQCSGTTTK